MLNDEIPATTKPLFEDLQMGSPLPDDKPEIVNRKAEAKRVINRISGIILEHREASLQLNVVLGWNELSIVINALRDHAQGGQGQPDAGEVLAGLDLVDSGVARSHNQSETRRGPQDAACHEIGSESEPPARRTPHGV